MVRVCSKFWTSHVVGFYCGTKGYLLYYNRNFLFYLFFIRSAATQGKEDCDYSLRAAINLTICLVQTHTLAHGLWKHAKCLGSTIYGLTKGYLRRRCQKHSNLSSGKQKKTTLWGHWELVRLSWTGLVCRTHGELFSLTLSLYLPFSTA